MRRGVISLCLLLAGTPALAGGSSLDKDAVRRVTEMTYENAEDYLIRAQEAANFFDDNGRKISLPADALQVDAEKRTLRIVFTSLLALNMAGPAEIPGNLRVRLVVDGDELQPFTAIYLPGTTAPPAQPATTTPHPAGS